MSIAESTKSTWMDVTNESVHTSDDVDIGDIEAINRDFIVVKRGIITVHYYYIPISKVEGWDGHVVWLKIPEKEVEKKYHIDLPPDPNRYYIKGHPYNETTRFTSSYFPAMPIIESKSKDNKKPSFSNAENSSQSKHTYDCPLCNRQFYTEDELSNHVPSAH